MYYHKCCVPGCNSLRQDVRLHKFPNCQPRYQKWLETISCSSLKALRLVDLSRLLVCHKHFEARFLTKKGRLLGYAYPTLFSPEEISSGIPSETFEDPENINHDIDHNYTKKRHKDHTYARTILSEHISTNIVFTDEINSKESIVRDQISSNESIVPDQIISNESVVPDQIISNESIVPDEINSNESFDPDEINSNASIDPDEINSNESIVPDEIIINESIAPYEIISNDRFVPIRIGDFILNIIYDPQHLIKV